MIDFEYMDYHHAEILLQQDNIPKNQDNRTRTMVLRRKIRIQQKE